MLIIFLTLLTLVSSDHQGSSDPLDWLREGVPGEPGVDYPIFAEIQDTSFTCAEKLFGGYYADPEMQCQGYHVCLTPPGAFMDRKTSFLCPNGTIFNQELFTCDWWFNVDCTAATGLYNLNEKIGDTEATIESSSDVLGQGTRGQNRRPSGGQTSGKAPIESRPSQKVEQPVGQQPARQQAVGLQPAKQQPARQQPVGQQPARQQPVRQQPAKQQPARQQPARQQPARQQPARQQPARQQPARQQPTSSQSVRGEVFEDTTLASYGTGSSSVDSSSQSQGTTGQRRQQANSLGRNQSPSGQTGTRRTQQTSKFEDSFDLVEYDATIPDSGEVGIEVPLLLADPFPKVQEPNSPRGVPRVPEQPGFLYDPPRRG